MNDERSEDTGYLANEPTLYRAGPISRDKESVTVHDLLAALDGLPSVERECLNLRFREGWPLARIAEHFHISPRDAARLVLNSCRQVVTHWGKKKDDPGG